MPKQKIPKSPTLCRKRSGASLIISIGIITVLTLVSLGVTTIVIASVRDFSNVNHSNQAYYAAEGALESGLLENQGAGAGFSTAASKNVTYTNANCTGANCQTSNSSLLHGSYEIKGQVPACATGQTACGQFQGGGYVGKYGIPTPGTGNVETNCSALTPVIKENFYYSPTASQHYIYTPNAPTNNDDPNFSTASYPPEDHPCNWNKIKEGETVSIPLYTTAADGTAINVLDSSSTFILRVRTGCANGDAYCEIRPQLDTTVGDANYGHDDAILNWQISAEDSQNGNKYNLNAFINYQSQGNQIGWISPSSIVTEGKINNSPAGNHGVVTFIGGFVSDINKCVGTLKDFFTLGKNSSYPCPIAPWGNNHISKPVLKLAVIHSMEQLGVANGNIPHLEYQLILSTVGNNMPADTSQTVTAQGFSSSFKQVLEVKVPQGNNLVEYVIQQ